MSYTFENRRVTVNGVVAWPDNTTVTGERRKLLKKHVVTTEELHRIGEMLAALEDHVASAANMQVKDSVSFLHDIRTSVGIVLSWTQELIDSHPGTTFEDKLQRADATTRNLFTSIDLLQEQLNLADIIANPHAITYGKAHQSRFHGFIYKMVKLFEPMAMKKQVNIVLRGNTNAEIVAYNSFQFIPLLLLDNAVKYSMRGKEIGITLREESSHVAMTISSFGRIVPEDYRDRIFDKYERGPNVENSESRGMGLGLYIARQIAVAHGTMVSYECHSGDGLLGSNEFIVSMEIVQPESEPTKRFTLTRIHQRASQR